MSAKLLLTSTEYYFQLKKKISMDLKRQVDVFYKMQCRIYSFIGLWKLPAHVPQQLRLIYNIYFWYILLFWISTFDLGCLLQIIANYSSINEILKVFFVFATSLAVMAKFLSIKLKNHKYLELFELMHQPDMLPVNTNEEKIFARTMALSRNVRKIYCYLSLTALNCVLLSQFIIDRTELPISLYMPINLDNIWRYQFVYTYQYVAVSIQCFVNIAFDSLGASFFIYLKGQLDILANRLENIGHKANDDDNKLISLQLKDCIRYYLQILKSTALIEHLVSIPMSVQMASSILVLMANFYAMSVTNLTADNYYLDLIKIIIYQACMIAQIFILCYFANEVSLKSSELSFALYKSNWYSWNKYDRKLVLLMMAQFDHPIRIKSINRCYSFNLAAFTSIVNSSYSYFALLNKINN